MPEGQFTGQRLPYLYTSDSGQVLLILLDATLGGLTGAGLTAATTANAGNATPKPQRFRCRGVHWQGTLGGRIVRKFITCAANGTLYQSGSPIALTIDGVAGSTTGRRGEKSSFQTLPGA